MLRQASPVWLSLHMAATSRHQIEKEMQAMKMKTMKQEQVLDLYFLDARHKLIELAAFLDRVERAEGDSDFRLGAFRDALTELAHPKPDKAKRVLMAFSDTTAEPIPAARYGPERLWMNSACNWGDNVPLAIPYTALEMRRRGHSAELIDQMIYRNPFQFLSQCPKFKLPCS